MAILLCGCACRTESVAPAPERGKTSSEVVDRAPVPDTSVSKRNEPLRFAPNNRYGWPRDFLLPLDIQFEVPEVPEAVSRPSPPIEDAPE